MRMSLVTPATRGQTGEMHGGCMIVKKLVDRLVAIQVWLQEVTSPPGEWRLLNRSREITTFQEGQARKTGPLGVGVGLERV